MLIKTGKLVNKAYSQAVDFWEFGQGAKVLYIAESQGPNKLGLWSMIQKIEEHKWVRNDWTGDSRFTSWKYTKGLFKNIKSNDYSFVFIWNGHGWSHYGRSSDWRTSDHVKRNFIV